MESSQPAKTFQMWREKALCGMRAELRDGLDDVRGARKGRPGRWRRDRDGGVGGELEMDLGLRP